MDKADFVHRTFQDISPLYDAVNSILSASMDRIWRMKTVRTLKFPKSALVLDLCAGTLPLTFELLKAPKKRSVALDLSLNMLKRGREKTPKDVMERLIGAVCGQGENLPFQNARFDGVMVAFGARNLADLKLGLAELFRVLKPKGRLAVLEFSRPGTPIFSTAYRLYLKHVLPIIAGWITGNRGAYEYLARSIYEFWDREEFITMIERTGFINVRTRPLTFGIVTIYFCDKTDR